MADDYSRLWVDYIDDADAEAFNDLEVRQEARVASAVGGGIELGYVETSTGFTTTSTAAGGVAVTGLSVTVIVGTRPIDVVVRADTWKVDGTPLGGALLLNIDGANQGVIASKISPNYDPLLMRRRLAPAAGSHTYAIFAKNVSAGTLTLIAGSGGGTSNSPMSIQVVEV